MKILISGLGGIGQRHLRNLRIILGEQAQIIGHDLRKDMPVLTDQLKVEEGVDLETKYGLHIYTDLDAALAQKPETVFICNPSSLHMDTAIRAARSNCHLFIEKPLSHNLDRVEELMKLLDQKGLKAVVGYQMRFHPCLQRLATLLEEKKVGRVLFVRAEIGEYMPGWHTYEDYRQIYASRRNLGGGVILSQIHEFDYLYWLFGLPERIFTLGGHLSSLEIDVEDSADTLMECRQEDRTVPVSLHQDYLQRPLSRFCEVYGESGKISVDLRALKVNVTNNAGELLEVSTFENFQRNQLFLDELNAFFQYIQGIPAPVVNLRMGIQSLRIALAAKESLEKKQVINLKREFS